MKIKENHLDTIVNNPYTNHTIQLRFLEEGMYIHIAKHYPEFFEVETLDNKFVKSSKLNDIKDEL